MRWRGAIAAMLADGLAQASVTPACAALARGGRDSVASGRSATRRPVDPRAPSGPPLVSGSAAYGAPSETLESESESGVASEDPLVRNGLRSPLCDLQAAALPAVAAGDDNGCATSGFLATSVPSEDWSFDTNIDTPLGSGLAVDPLLQDYLVRPAWMGLVWLVHALLVGLEWSFVLGLLRGPLSGYDLGHALRGAEAELTRPWLASALALAAVLAAYDGLVRRRVAQTLGEAATTLAMIAAAMFVIADPRGTVGAISQWTGEASAGAFGAVRDGNADPPYAALAASLRELYAASIEAPWCFLEFGDVSWCDQPRRLDPRLRKAGLRIAGKLEAQASERGHGGGGEAEALRTQAQLLRQARTNGEIFLALPPNGQLRNSVKDEESLLFTLCGGGPDATQCRGPTATEAEFRTAPGTLPRIGGVLTIALGVLGMLLLLGFVTMRLLESAVLSALLLLLAPVAALAPVWGKAGRAAFRGWASRLLAATTAKLLWSLLLGALLMTLRLLLALEGIGWLVQWLLIGTFWWGAFLQRHRLLARSGGRVKLVGARTARGSGRGERALVATGRSAAMIAWRGGRSGSSRSFGWSPGEQPVWPQQPGSSRSFSWSEADQPAWPQRWGAGRADLASARAAGLSPAAAGFDRGGSAHGEAWSQRSDQTKPTDPKETTRVQGQPHAAARTRAKDPAHAEWLAQLVGPSGLMELIRNGGSARSRSRREAARPEPSGADEQEQE